MNFGPIAICQMLRSLRDLSFYLANTFLTLKLEASFFLANNNPYRYDRMIPGLTGTPQATELVIDWGT